ncbi:MAG: MGMT family protein [Caldilineaceae bacterium]|nr:MGMT family protein [Caldilineaceae bacterium]
MSRSPADSWYVNGPTQERIYLVVRQIPPGKVSTYGDIAAIVGDCTARMVGYAMAAARGDLPWHRVINAQGKISPRGDGGGEELQRARLEDEGIHFSDGKVDLKRVRWLGPSVEWKIANGFAPDPTWREK